jgi:16S rRNA (guanine(966)-N(2))-methyltransferase RsmD
MSFKIIAGKFKGRGLKTPKIKTTRPTQGILREAVFNICQNEIHHSHFLDLFAGSGAMGLEALSRGAAHVTFVEQNRGAATCIRENIEILGLTDESTLIPSDATRALAMLAKQSAQFQIVYIDPPYDTPFSLTALIPILAPQALVFLEERHNPKKIYAAHTAADFYLRDTRRFGIALLSTYCYKKRV